MSRSTSAEQPEITEGQVWVRRSDGQRFEVTYVGLSGVDVRNLRTCTVSGIREQSLRRGYELVAVEER